MNREQENDAAEVHTVRPPIRIFRWRVVLLGGITIAATTAAVISWLCAEAGSDPKLRIEAIRTGFTVGFGLGGGLALILAANRQWLQERAQAHQEEVAAVNQAHQERVAAANEHDASERRITELFVKAVEQLGSAKAPVRHGGLHALERLAQANPDQRQTIGDVICAYLRMPFAPPEETPEQAVSSRPDATPATPTRDHEEDARRREELQVRLTAQRILATHLRNERYAGQNDAEPPPVSFWGEIDIIDLTGAHLVDLNLQHCRIATLQLNQAVLTGESVFRGMTCVLAFIQEATFCGHADFRGVTFKHDAWFAYSTFLGPVWFDPLHEGPSRYEDPPHGASRFGGRASFKGVTFAQHALFHDVTFAGAVDFSETHDDAPRLPHGHALRLDGAHVNQRGSALILPSGWTSSDGIIKRSSPEQPAQEPHDDGADGSDVAVVEPPNRRRGHGGGPPNPAAQN